MSDPEFPERLDRDPAPPPRPAPRGRPLLAAGVAAALALGAIAGLVMRPELDDGDPDRQRPVREAEVPRLPDDLGLLSPPATPAPPQVDPNAMAELEEEPEPEPEPEPEEPDEPDEPEPEPDDEEPVLRRFDEVAPRPLPAPRLTVNCARAGSMAERLVCADPRLRTLDRRMAAAYGDALASGVPPPVLRGQQQAWLRAREQAARYGPADVAGVYQARIAELRDMTR